MLPIAEVRKMDEKALLEKVATLKKDLFDMKLKKLTSGLEKPHLLKDSKKAIARCLTVLNELRKENGKK